MMGRLSYGTMLLDNDAAEVCRPVALCHVLGVLVHWVHDACGARAAFRQLPSCGCQRGAVGLLMGERQKNVATTSSH
mgnify:CR=1 FL=1